MRCIFFIIIIIGVSDAFSQQMTQVTDTLANGSIRKAYVVFKTIEQIPDSFDIGIAGGYLRIRLPKSILTPSQGGGISQQTLNDTANAIRTTVNGKEPVINAGTTAQYYRGDKTWRTYQGYSINVQALTSSPADGQTIYFGMLPKAPVTTAGQSKVHIRKDGTITIANIYCYSGTAGSNNNWSIYIRVNNTTDHLIQTLGASTNERIFTNSSLSIAVSAGDYIEIKCVNPTWSTNPLTTIFGGYIYIE